MVIFSFGAIFYIHLGTRGRYSSYCTSLMVLSIKLDGGYEFVVKLRHHKTAGVSTVTGQSAELGQGSKVASNLRTTVTFQLSGQAQDVPEMELELELPLVVEVPFSFLEVSQKCEGLSSPQRGKTPLSQKIPTSRTYYSLFFRLERHVPLMSYVSWVWDPLLG